MGRGYLPIWLNVFSSSTDCVTCYLKINEGDIVVGLCLGDTIGCNLNRLDFLGQKKRKRGIPFRFILANDFSLADCLCLCDCQNTLGIGQGNGCGVEVCFGGLESLGGLGECLDHFVHRIFLTRVFKLPTLKVYHRRERMQG